MPFFHPVFPKDRRLYWIEFSMAAVLLISAIGLIFLILERSVS